MPGPMRKISDETAQLIRKEYEAGATLKQLAEKYDISVMSISRSVVRAGGEVRNTGRPSMYNAAQLQKMRTEYEAGASLRYLSTVYGGHYTNIGAAIQKAGGKLRPRTRRDRSRTRGLLSWLDS